MLLPFLSDSGLCSKITLCRAGYGGVKVTIQQNLLRQQIEIAINQALHSHEEYVRSDELAAAVAAGIMVALQNINTEVK